MQIRWKWFHRSQSPFAYALTSHRARLVCAIEAGAAVAVHVYTADRYVSQFAKECLCQEMRKNGSDENWDWYVIDVEVPTRRLLYQFSITDRQEPDGLPVFLGGQGADTDRSLAGYFHLPYLCSRDLYQVPEWVRQTTVYQIFPDRFYRAGSKEHVSESEWYTTPTASLRLGGNLAGILEKLPFLQELGVGLIYLTPIFLADSNHKYNTTDYLQVDPDFGTFHDVARLVEEAHQRGMRVMLDAVFNHAGYDFAPFQDVLHKGKDSAYWDWFFIHGDTVSIEPVNYETFANDVRSMPKLNVAHPDVEAYLLQVARYWIEETGIDGWRLDVANEVDHVFWRKFRETVKSCHPQCLIIGEVWHDSLPWLQGDQFDGVMNYLFRENVLDYFIRETTDEKTYAARMTNLLYSYPRQADLCMFNLLGSHDTERVMTLANHQEDKVARALIAQFTFPGMPMIYYGDEVGMEGGADPDCRRGMEWRKERQNQNILNLIKRLARLKREESALASDYLNFLRVEPGILQYERVSEDSRSRVLITFNHRPSTVSLPISDEVLLAYPEQAYDLSSQMLAPDGVVITRVDTK